MGTRVKICGFTQPADAVAAAQLGVDAIGLVFCATSPRVVSIHQAQAIQRVLPPFVTVVGLFVDAVPDFIRSVLESVPLDVLQFHGDEQAAECAGYGRPYIKAIRMRPGEDILKVSTHYMGAQGLLLDTYMPHIPGGTGRPFDWTQVPAGIKKPLILAGGLNPANVVEAILTVKPYAVDVSGGVESMKAKKDHDLMRRFITAVRSVQVAS